MPEFNDKLQAFHDRMQAAITAYNEFRECCNKATAPKAAAKPETAAEAPKPLTLEQVRAVLAEKSRAGHTDAVRELLKKHGAEKLSEIDPGKYAALLAEAEGLENG